MTRREFLGSEPVALTGSACRPKPAPTKFQIACMTLPYSRFPLDRALEGHQGGRLQVRRLGHDPQGRRQGRAGDGAGRDRREKAKELGEALPRHGPRTGDDVPGIYPEAKDGLEVLDAAHQAGGGRGRAAGAHVRPHQGRQPQALGRALQGSSGPIASDNNVTARRQAARRRNRHRRGVRRDHARGRTIRTSR